VLEALKYSTSYYFERPLKLGTFVGHHPAPAIPDTPASPDTPAGSATGSAAHAGSAESAAPPAERV